MDLHSNTNVTPLVVTAIGVEVTYLGPGPPSENLKPVITREETCTKPTGLLVLATDKTGDKTNVCLETSKVKAFATLGLDGEAPIV